MKKITLIACCLGLALALWGCSSAEKAPVESDMQQENLQQEESPEQPEADPDPVLADLYAQNNMLKLLEEHNQVYYSTSICGEDGSEISNTKTIFLREELGPRVEAISTYSDGTSSYMSAFVDEKHPGALYLSGDSLRVMTIYPAEEYDAAIAALWLPESPDPAETLLSQEEVDGMTQIKTKRVDEEMGGYYLTTYMVDPASGLIQSKEYSHFDDADVCYYVSSIALNYEDAPEVFYAEAEEKIIYGLETCRLSLVTNPGTDAEQRLTHNVTKDTQVNFGCMKDYILYGNVDCTKEIQSIDVSKNNKTVYAVPRD